MDSLALYELNSQRVSGRSIQDHAGQNTAVSKLLAWPGGMLMAKFWIRPSVTACR